MTLRDNPFRLTFRDHLEAFAVGLVFAVCTMLASTAVFGLLLTLGFYVSRLFQ